MVCRQLFQKIAATVAISGMLFSVVPGITWAATTLSNGQINGLIRTNSPVFRFRNQSRQGAPLQTAVGEEYVFTARQGDIIQVSVNVENRNRFSPILVLSASRNGRQVAYNDTTNSLRYQVPVAGEYKLLVLSQNNLRGRYTLSVSGISDGTVSQTPSTQTIADRRREFLQNEYGLRVLDSCPAVRSSLVTVAFNEYGRTYTYCANPNRAIKAGDYAYDASTNELRAAGSLTQNPSTQATTPDRRREFLQNEYGLRVLDTCPTVRTSLVVAYFSEYGQTTTYCASPNRAIRAGEYTYNASTNELTPGTPAAQTSAQTTATDNRARLLQNDYGLTVLNGCPVTRSSLVVVNFNESAQTYTYCANPNRNVPVGEYTYNASTGNLDVATKTPQQQCSVVVGGVCLVK